jgi:hypothetical protein
MGLTDFCYKSAQEPAYSISSSPAQTVRPHTEDAVPPKPNNRGPIGRESADNPVARALKGCENLFRTSSIPPIAT